jgi:carbohydrate diacid regulator
MANRLFQSIIHQMKDAVDRVIGVIDESGSIIACSDLVRIGEQKQDFGQYSLMKDSGDVFFFGGYAYRRLDPSNNEYTVFAEGEDRTAEMVVRMVSVSLMNIKNLHDDKYDRASFLKSIILDNILPSDIFIKSKELNFNSSESRVVLLIKFQDKTDFLPFEMLQNMFPDRQRDYIITLGEYEVVLVMEVKPTTDQKEIEAVAARIIDTLVTEFYVNASIGISTVVDNIKDLGTAYKEAQVALDVGKVFESDKRYISYCNLGIGRLIYQLPATLCEMYLHEVFRSGSIEALDEDTLETIECFFDNNLNVSETSRKLYIHRNTLVYRIEKIRKLTGLDLREFDNAITFRVALMVRQYLATKYIPGKTKRLI